MRPLTIFEQNFRSPSALLKIYRLLKYEEGETEELEELIREHLSVPGGEETFLISNDALHGLVRALAGLSPGFFQNRNLSLLLRQAVVAACSAADVYYNDIVTTYGPVILLGRKQQAPSKLHEVPMTLGDYISLSEYSDPKEKIRQVITKHLSRSSLSNVNGIATALQMMGVGKSPEQVWHLLEDQTGHSYGDLRDQISDLVSRRNDIVHRGDRSRYEKDADEPQEIDFPWADGHIQTLKKVVLASDGLVQEHLEKAAEASSEDG